MLGTVLPARNDEWLNAAPRAYAAFSSSNGDLKFPQRLPIPKETHEVLIYSATPLSVMAGYFGGYTAKMQDIGLKEIRRLSQLLDRQRPGATANKNQAEAFQYYSRRLVRDLEAKGIVRSLHSADTEILMAECIRTFPSTSFPASLLLKREEVECRGAKGVSVLAGVFHGKGKRHLMFVEAPFDLLYGFRGTEHNVDLLSPYEMLLHWSLEKITARCTKKEPKGSCAIYSRRACTSVRVQSGKPDAKVCAWTPLHSTGS